MILIQFVEWSRRTVQRTCCTAATALFILRLPYRAHALGNAFLADCRGSDAHRQVRGGADP